MAQPALTSKNPNLDLKDSRSIIKIPPILFIVTILILEVKMVVDNGAIQIIK